MINLFDEHLDIEQKAVMHGLTDPVKIQAFLDGVPYSPEDVYRCPLEVLQDRKAHCMDGALFAAAALRRLGYPPLVVDLVPEPGTDDDHMLAIFKQHGHFGAVAKSNYVGLRFREAVYRSLRELVMSYFEQYFNLYGKKTLRFYTRPVNLARFDRVEWMWKPDGLVSIEHYFDAAKQFPAISAEMAAELSGVDPRSLEAGLAGSNPAGLYQPIKVNPSLGRNGND
jgi:hypothetical protein